MVLTFGDEELLSGRVLSRSLVSNTHANSLLPILPSVLNENVVNCLLQGKNHPWLKTRTECGRTHLLPQQWRGEGRGGSLILDQFELPNKNLLQKENTTKLQQQQQQQLKQKASKQRLGSSLKEYMLSFFEALSSILSIPTKMSRKIQDIKGNKSMFILGKSNRKDMS